MKIGIMGGTFDPIHLGHLILSEYIRIEAGLDRIIFIPTGYPPHKNDILDGKMRLEMIDLAIEANPYFISSDIEINRPDTSYTIDTVKDIKEIYPDSELYMIVGSDTLFSLYTWKGYPEILTEIDFIVADRLGLYPIDVDKEILRLNDRFKSNILCIDSPKIEISSTLIRYRIRKGLSIKYLVPDIIENYILKNGLYR